MSQAHTENLPTEYPSLVKRIQAMFVDFLIILAVFSVTSLLLSTTSSDTSALRVAILVFCFILYEPLLITFNGGTVGHYLLGLRVKKHTNTIQNISFILALVRIISKATLGWISFLTVNSNQEKRAIHDMISGSVVRLK